MTGDDAGLVGGAALGMVCLNSPAGAVDISEHRSWPAYLASPAPA